MSKKKLPYFPLFLGDLIVATPRPTWKGQHRALYTILLAHQWFYGRIPSEPEAIADMCDYPVEEFKRLWQVVSTKFVGVEGGLINLRCEEHREKAAKISNKRSHAGRKGGETTKQKAQQTRRQIEQQNGQQTGQQTGQQVAAPFARPSIPSHPIPSDSIPNARSAREISLSRSEEEEQSGDPDPKEAWIRCMRAFPPYNGRKHWIMAENAACRLVQTDRATWDVIEDRTTRYATFCRVTKRAVMRPENFFSTIDDPPCLQSWDLPDQADASTTRGDDVIAEWLKEQQAKEG